ncbi:MAG TPA: DUF5947 family protein [Tepidisphaeraceae bacterium]|nr:DUF5947 family protein [Tepidisphaeraceae bacterium]
MESSASSPLVPQDAPNAEPGRISPGALAALRRFARPRPPRERCDLCAADLAVSHQHLFSPADRKLACACDACAILFSGGQSSHYRLVPRRGEYWPNFHLADADWQAMNIPINLAFFTVPSLGEQVQAFYPSPAGATESLVPAEAWEAIKNENPRLNQLLPDVEALLVNRVGSARDYYRAPIDECYKLVGLIRGNWRGLSGGADVWKAIAEFFRELKEKSVTRND